MSKSYQEGVIEYGGESKCLSNGKFGSRKTTLINSVFNFERAAVGTGKSVTEKMTIYQSEDVDLRAIDTKGLEYGWLAQIQNKNAIKKWSKDNVKIGNEEKYIHIIGYCVDAISKRFFNKNLDTIKNVAKMWGNIPIIIVLTKSYSETEAEENILMLRKCLEGYKGLKYLNVVDIVPVVAQQFPVNNEIIILLAGVAQLIEKTYEIIPESLKINKAAVFELGLKIKRASANALVAAATSGAGVVGTVPIPIADAIVLSPLQIGRITGICHHSCFG